MTPRGRKAYFVATLVSQAVALFRYVAMARLLGPVELGFAAMLLLTSQFFESISDTGSDRFLIQDPEGDTPKMLGFVHLVMAGRGLLIAASLAIFAIPLAGVYHSPKLVTSLILLGVAPIIGGFANLDFRRVQRHGDFRPESLVTIVSETTGFAATVVAAWLFRDHTAVIYGYAARSASMVLVSHLTTNAPYRWAIGGSQSARFSRFAAPLFLNGLLLYAGSQGDRLIVANRVGPAALGHYSAILLLIYYPASALARFIAGMHLPLVAAARNDPEALDKQAQRLAGRTLLLAVAMAAGFALVGPIVTPLLYGKRFAQGALIFALLGCVQSVRFLRCWPTALAMAVGRSTIVMANNIARMLAFPAAFAATLLWPSLASIVAGFLVGEVVAIMVALSMLARTSTIKLGPEARRIRDFVLVAVALIASGWAVETARPLLAAVAIAATLAGLALTVWNERKVVTWVWRTGRQLVSRYSARFWKLPRSAA